MTACASVARGHLSKSGEILGRSNLSILPTPDIHGCDLRPSDLGSPPAKNGGPGSMKQGPILADTPGRRGIADFSGARFNGKGTAAPNRGVPFCLHRDLPGGRIGAPANAPAGMGSPNAWYQGWGSPPRPTAGEKVSSRCGARRGASRRGAETTAGVALSPGPQSAYGVAALPPGSGNRLLSGGMNGG